MNAHIRKVALLACALLFATSAVGRSATEKVFQSYNIAVTVPDSWKDVTAERPQPGLIVAFRDPGNTRAVLVSQMDFNGPFRMLTISSSSLASKRAQRNRAVANAFPAGLWPCKALRPMSEPAGSSVTAILFTRLEE